MLCDWRPATCHRRNTPLKFVGVDLHKQTITLVVVDAARRMLARKRFSNLMSEQIVQFLKALGEFQLTVEATASYEWFVQLVEPQASRIVLAHPGKLRVIAESTRKSDKLDAKVLAEMLALDQIPASYRPTPRQRGHRQLVRQRQFWQRKITGVRNKIRRILSDYNLDRRDLFTVARQAWLKTATVSSIDRFCLDQLVEEWTGLVLRRRETKQKLREFAKEGSDTEQLDRGILKTIPGVGPVNCEVILAELADARRFSSLKKCRGRCRSGTGPARIGWQAPEPAHRTDRLAAVALGAGAGGVATREAFAEVADDLREPQGTHRRQEGDHRRHAETADDLRHTAQTPGGLSGDHPDQGRRASTRVCDACPDANLNIIVHSTVKVLGQSPDLPIGDAIMP